MCYDRDHTFQGTKAIQTSMVRCPACADVPIGPLESPLAHFVSQDRRRLIDQELLRSNTTDARNDILGCFGRSDEWH
jgi:hypothetical protein